MPNRRPEWHLRIPEILDTLNAPQGPPFLDRPCVEFLFRVKRRQAIRLLAKCGGYQTGKTFIVDRQKMTAFLESLLKDGKAHYALAQRRRVIESLTEAKNDRVAEQTRIKMDPEVFARRSVELPQSVELMAPGRLQVTFTDAEDLLARLAELLSAATKDYFGFQKLIEGEK